MRVSTDGERFALVDLSADEATLIATVLYDGCLAYRDPQHQGVARNLGRLPEQLAEAAELEGMAREIMDVLRVAYALGLEA